MHFGRITSSTALLVVTSLLGVHANAQTLGTAPTSEGAPPSTPEPALATSATAPAAPATPSAAPEPLPAQEPVGAPRAPAEPVPAPTAELAARPTADAPAEVKPPAPPTQLKLEIANGTSIRFGLLWQGQYEGRGNPGNSDLTHNLYLRRFALLFGGTILNDVEFFVDTDFADLLKAPTGDQGLRNGPGISVKDALVTYRAVDDRLKIDAGLLIPPGSHNSLQGGGTIYGWDFFLNTFRHNAVFGNTGNVLGRDVGLQLRGIILDGLLEYRVGIFQGKRNAPLAGPPARPGARNPFRFAGRVQLNFLDPETGYFYAGTYLGTKKVFSIGGSADFQQDDEGSYRSFAGDAFLDLPAGPGGVTAQANLVYRDGGALVDLPKQTFLGLEAGYRIDAIKLSPIVRFEQRWGRGAAADETDLGGGLAYWFLGHNSNLKAFYTRATPKSPARAFDQFNIQWQAFFY